MGELTHGAFVRIFRGRVQHIVRSTDDTYAEFACGRWRRIGSLIPVRDDYPRQCEQCWESM